MHQMKTYSDKMIILLKNKNESSVDSFSLYSLVFVRSVSSEDRCLTVDMLITHTFIHHSPLSTLSPLTSLKNITDLIFLTVLSSVTLDLDPRQIFTINCTGAFDVAHSSAYVMHFTFVLPLNKN